MSNTDLIEKNNPPVLLDDFISEDFLQLATGVAKTMVDDKGKMVLSIGHLAQSIHNRTFFQQLHQEMKDYQKIGKQDKEKLKKSRGQTIFVDLLKTIDAGELDDTKFNALKSIFFSSIEPDSDEKQQIVAYQLFQECKRLSSLDILILKEAYTEYKKMKKGAGVVPVRDITNWTRYIGDRLGLPHDLINNSRVRNSIAGNPPNTVIFLDSYSENTFGLTNTGIAIGEYLEKYDMKPNE